MLTLISYANVLLFQIVFRAEAGFPKHLKSSSAKGIIFAYSWGHWLYIYTLLVDNMRNMCMPRGTKKTVDRTVYKAHLQNTDIKQ